jgi:hypothetical protein
MSIVKSVARLANFATRGFWQTYSGPADVLNVIPAPLTRSPVDTTSTLASPSNGVFGPGQLAESTPSTCFSIASGKLHLPAHRGGYCVSSSYIPPFPTSAISSVLPRLFRPIMPLCLRLFHTDPSQLGTGRWRSSFGAVMHITYRAYAAVGRPTRPAASR